ncbi:SymE family type I addiction module toxin [Chitinophaga sp. 30R24]|uniref:SymE family type I addiction module toxin n=1 Tax=Chitinophaga sp. 30R24 TaxID=3248838 RepID=UPI003B9029D5
MQTKTIRRCKVHVRPQEVNKLYRDGRSGYRDVAWFRIGGLWMEKRGFNVGDPIEVTVENGVMTIKKLAANGDSGN